MRLLLAFGVALGLFVVASSLTCKSCKFRIYSVCLLSSSTPTCAGNCSLTKASYSGTSLFVKQSCEDNCTAKNTTRDSIFDLDYAVTCCNTDQCNSASSAKVSLSLGLGIFSLWLLKAL